MSNEQFLIRLEGGREPPEILVDAAQYPWPLPGIIPARGGRYEKVQESDLPPQQPGSGILRGARYVWRPETETERAH